MSNYDWTNCTRCAGSGMVGKPDPTTGKPVRVTCPTCGGSGKQR